VLDWERRHVFLFSDFLAMEGVCAKWRLMHCPRADG
jgi:hypothetical protein